jgi:pyrroloquinoline quinone biosynthesis protein A
MTCPSFKFGQTGIVGTYGKQPFDVLKLNFKRRFNMWSKPEVTEMRFGFEVTMYVCNR